MTINEMSDVKLTVMPRAVSPLTQLIVDQTYFKSSIISPAHAIPDFEDASMDA